MNEYAAEAFVRLTLAALVALSGLASLIFDVLFPFILQSSSLKQLQAVAIVNSIIGILALTHLLLLLHWQLKNSRRVYPFCFGRKRYGIHVFSFISALFRVSSSIGTMLLLGIMITRLSDLPKNTLHFSTRNLIIGAFVSQAMYITSLCIYVITIARFRPKINSSQLDELGGSWEIKREMEQSDNCQRFSLDSEIFSSHCYSKNMSENQPLFTPPNLSNNLSEIKNVRPIEEFCLAKTYAQYISSVGLTKVPDYHFRQLETIPGTPTTIGSPNTRQIFPKNSDSPWPGKLSHNGSMVTNNFKYPRSRTSKISVNESHIHPLFRTNSKSHPDITPGTIVTAAPGAGLLVLDLASICSLKSGKGNFGIETLSKTQQNIRFSDMQMAQKWDATRALLLDPENRNIYVHRDRAMTS